MRISESIPVVTGAGRGLGSALIDECLERGASKVYGLARDPGKVRCDRRVVALEFDLSRRETIEAAAEAATDATLLLNNAAVAAFTEPLEVEEAELREMIEVNLFGTFATMKAFIPVIESNGGGQIVNVNSLVGLASLPLMTSYSASKAAIHSMTQAFRPALKEKAITIHGAYCGSIDTDMNRHIESKKTSAGEVAAGILDALEAEQEEIWPDPSALRLSEIWKSDPKEFEQVFAAW